MGEMHKALWSRLNQPVDTWRRGVFFWITASVFVFVIQAISAWFDWFNMDFGDAIAGGIGTTVGMAFVAVLTVRSNTRGTNTTTR